MGTVKAMRIFTGLGIAAVIFAAAVFFLREEIAGWWLQRQLVGEVSRLIGADVKLEGTGYRDGVLNVARCRVSGDAMPFASLEMTDARMPVSWQRLRDWSGEPLPVEAAAVDLVWRDAPHARKTGIFRGGENGAAKLPAFDILVGKFSFRHEDPAQWRIKDAALRAGYANDAWTLAAQSGTFSVQGWPEFRIERLSGKQRGKEWNLASFALHDGGNGVVGGSANARDGEWSGEFSWQDIALRGLLPAGADEYFSGRGSGDARLAGGVLDGQMKIEGATVQNFPALVKLASIFTGENYDTVPWPSLRFKFRRGAGGTLDIGELAGVSPKGLAVQGSARISGQNIAGEIQLGIQREGRPWLVAFMPALFRAERQGYMWTPVKIGGTLQAPTEDLTPRIVASLAAVPATKAVETAVEIPAGAVDAAGGLLRGLLGR